MRSELNRWCLVSLILGMLLVQGRARAALVDPGLTGTTQFDGWVNLTSANFPGYGTFPGNGAWPAPIGSNQTSSGDANLNKVSPGAGGGAFPAGEGIYHGGVSGTPNIWGGTESVTDSTPVSGLTNIVFQTLVSEAFGYELFNDARPVLNFNGGSQAIAPNYYSKVRVDTGMTFPNPITGVDEALFHTTRVQQWDLSGIGEPITSIAVVFSPVQHAIILELRLDQSNTFSWVPEPASMGCLGLIGLMPGRRGRRRCR